MAKYKIFTFVSFFAATVLGVIVCGICGWNLEYTAFFFFSANFFMHGTNQFFEYHKRKSSSRAIVDKLKGRVLMTFLMAFTLLFIGVMHVLGNLKFPEFMFIDGWDNGYALTTRIAWFVSLCLGGFLYQKYKLEELSGNAKNRQNRSKEKENFSLWKIPSKVLLFPTLSIPTVVLISDLLGIRLAREIVTQLLLFF